ncbi:formimidoylglutamate deiminase [Xinfangfangia sp. CPCC 101601]|uniref:Formimidoylglutamate deiminase n=1 Tax=Pseudogemmobacter lacusdianii TaxID=3069608 RepID=A0ABU0VW89_9RHOB|nr:formimidoylglutamate deiminase [Xinfangfangia sp. CPCC 101601]MDQ2066026.1 formimidoylglutamate deiminase [Xinfangfangia sp. CPCC 101601]
MRIHAAAALLPAGWVEDVRVELSESRIAGISVGVPAQADDTRVEALIPGMPNLHSHTFQRGFSGLTELRGPGKDSFWTWREVMYRFALQLNPEGVQAIAALACVEMLEAGYTRLGEFHYLHHAPDGRPYDDPAELSLRIFAAAEETGIALTHLPVFYAHGGFGGAAPNEGQRRFLHSLDAFDRLMERCEARMTRPQDRLGLAPHSLRGATPEEIRYLAAQWPDRPFHIHIAEQVKEVEDSLAHSGARPVEALLAETPVGPNWCLIHATHLTEAEITGIAQSGAVAGLCPVTEANLGDGIFPAPGFLAQGGRFGVGTDSNVAISVAQELQMLEYSQRLSLRGRNICTEAGSTGTALFNAALQGGAQALAAPQQELATGAPADLVALRDPMALSNPASLLDRWIFGSGVAVDQVWASGRHVVQDGRHPERDRIRRAASEVMRKLL